MEINLQEVRTSFIATSRDILQKSEALLLDLEKSADAERYAELLRAIHTIKGNAGIFELKPVIQLCHALETRIETLKNSGQYLGADFIDLGLTALDRIQTLIGAMDDTGRRQQIDIAPVLAQLEAGEIPASTPAQGDMAHHNRGLKGIEWIKSKAQTVKLSEKYLEQAKRKNTFLSFVVLDLGAQNGMSIAEFYEKIKRLHKNRSLLSIGMLRGKLFLHREEPGCMPYFLILNTSERVEKILADLGLSTIVEHYFWQPPDLRGAPEPVQRENIAEGSPRETHLKVHIELLNNLIGITGEIVLSRNALLRKVEQGSDPGLSAFAKKLSQLVTNLQDKVMKTRLQAVAILFQRLPRLVRETAAQTGKKAELTLTGGDIEIDKAIIDDIADPLVHIIRNAIDHGLESTMERIQAGKNETGNIAVSAEMREGNIVVRVTDDGRGLDNELIRKIALQKGLISPEAAANATQQEIAEYIFLPGFSTKNEITTISGRGVGMDVVRTNIMKLGGSVDIAGTPGLGTSVTMLIPQTLSIITCLVVEVAGGRFVIPQQNIAEVVTIDPARLRNIQGKEAYELRGQLLPLVFTAALLEIEDTKVSDRLFVVVRTEKYHYGLKVQRVLDNEEVVVKTLPQFGNDRQVFSGAAIMGDGEIALILDATLIPKLAALQGNGIARSANPNIRQLADSATQYLLFRAYGKKLAFKVAALPRIESISPENIETIINRKVVRYRNELIPILPLNFLKAPGSEEEITRNLIILQAEGRKYGLLASEILDIVADDIELRREKHDRHEIEGYAIIGKETVVVLSIPELLKSVPHEKPGIPLGEEKVA